MSLITSKTNSDFQYRGVNPLDVAKHAGVTGTIVGSIAGAMTFGGHGLDSGGKASLGGMLKHGRTAGVGGGLVVGALAADASILLHIDNTGSSPQAAVENAALAGAMTAGTVGAVRYANSLANTGAISLRSGLVVAALTADVTIANHFHRSLMERSQDPIIETATNTAIGGGLTAATIGTIAHASGSSRIASLAARTGIVGAVLAADATILSNIKPQDDWFSGALVGSGVGLTMGAASAGIIDVARTQGTLAARGRSALPIALMAGAAGVIGGALVGGYAGASNTTEETAR